MEAAHSPQSGKSTGKPHTQPTSNLSHYKNRTYADCNNTRTVQLFENVTSHGSCSKSTVWEVHWETTQAANKQSQSLSKKKKKKKEEEEKRRRTYADCKHKDDATITVRNFPSSESTVWKVHWKTTQAANEQVQSL